MKKPLLSAVLLALAVPALAAQPKHTQCSPVTKAQLRVLYETQGLSQALPVGTGKLKFAPDYLSSIPDETLNTWRNEVNDCEQEIIDRNNLSDHVADLDRLSHRDIVDLYIFVSLYYDLDYRLSIRSPTPETKTNK